MIIDSHSFYDPLLHVSKVLIASSIGILTSHQTASTLLKRKKIHPPKGEWTHLRYYTSNLDNVSVNDWDS